MCFLLNLNITQLIHSHSLKVSVSFKTIIMIDRFLYQLVSIQLVNEPVKYIKGIVLDFNADWILIKRNTNEFVTDGYALIRRDKVVAVDRNEEVKYVEEVLKAKFVDFTSFPIHIEENIFIILKNISVKYEALMLNTKDTICLGSFFANDDNEYFAIDEFSVTGDWLDIINEFNIHDIYTIVFDTDYIQSLLLFANKKVSN